jgi:DNA-binding response OmpR family regulator
MRHLMARVLLAESDIRIRTMIAGILADFGHQVEECADAAEAGRRLQAQPIDVVVTDLVLGSGDAVELSRESVALGIPIVTLTGRRFGAPSQGRGDALQPLVDKPFRFADLQMIVDAVAAYAPAPIPGPRARCAA